jgi:hypothetical protein
LGNAAITDVKTNGAITAAGFKVPGGNSGQYLRADGTFATLTTSVVPYTGASQAVDLGAYDLKVNGITVGVGSKTITSTSNTAIGNLALSRNTEGKWNSANGFSTLKNNTTGYNNTANGAFSLISNTIGNDNTAIGLHAGSSNMIGSMNTSIGSEALMQNYTGSNNTALGYQADVASANLSNATAIGSGAVVSTSNTIQLGNTAVTDVKTSGSITAAGFKVPGGTSAQYLKADGSVATSVTAGVPYSGASQAVDLGAYDLKVNGITIGVGSKTITSTNIIDNTAIGNGVLINNRTGLANTANGYNALQNNTSGSSNTAIGAFTLLYNTTGGYNTAIGIGAIYNNTSGSNNTATGLSASYRNTTGDNNTANGFEALQTNSTGSNNTALGYRADVASANLSNAAAIGSGAVVSASNTIQLGNTSITSVVTSGTIKSNGMISNLVSKTSAYTVQTSDEIITGDATSASFTISLPTAVGITGQTFTIKRMNAGVNSVSIGTTSSQTIDGAPSWVLNAQYKYLKVVSNGANWLIIANN